MKSILKQLLSFILPITATVIIPLFILNGSIVLSENIFLKILGYCLIGIGVSVLVMTIRTFILIGKGTLAPWSPTSNLIVGGIYSYVRNPMIMGVLTILIGESILFLSKGIFIWAICFFFVNHIYFIKSEEPGLIKKFGKDYEDYKKSVPRWVPKIKPFTKK